MSKIANMNIDLRGDDKSSHIKVDDPMLLGEKVQQYAQGHGWDGQIVTLEQALGVEEKNISDYLQSFQAAERFMNDMIGSAGGLMGSADKGRVWKSNSAGNQWGLVDADSDNPFNEEEQEINVSGLNLNQEEINEQEEKEEPIQ